MRFKFGGGLQTAPFSLTQVLNWDGRPSVDRSARSETGAQLSLELETGAQLSLELETGAQLSLELETGAQPAFRGRAGPPGQPRFFNSPLAGGGRAEMGDVAAEFFFPFRTVPAKSLAKTFDVIPVPAQVLEIPTEMAALIVQSIAVH